MPRVIFWNVARSGGREGPLATDMLCEDLAGLADSYRPDLMLLCECIQGFSRNSRACPDGYNITQPLNTRLYTRTTMLRYAVLRRNGLQCQVRLVGTATEDRPRLRPALAVIVPGGAKLIAMHAASISNSHSIQMQQLVTAHQKLLGAHSSGHEADILIGDFNIDINEPGTRAAVRGRLHGTELADYQPRGPREQTHRKGKTLDWTLLKPGLKASIRRVTEDEEPQGREYKNKFQNQKEER